jgi:hypothetical protein
MLDKKDWGGIVGNVGSNQYKDRIEFLKSNRYDTSAIERTIEKTIKSFQSTDNKSFVIFGEPQSGKTEMMIALNAKLLDLGCNIIINLLNDSIELLEQNLSRFLEANLSPAPKQFSEMPKNINVTSGKQWIIFSKKNARDLEKLNVSLSGIDNLVIIDDEADYASPNSKINRGERTKINQLIQTLLSSHGKYIGVTATPARLDLNNTFENNTDFWVNFESHLLYVGQDFFFPINGQVEYKLHTFDISPTNEGNILVDAILHFLCGVAEQHILRENKKNFTMLIHTSGNTTEHTRDCNIVENTISILSNPKDENFHHYKDNLIDIAKDYNSQDPSLIAVFVLKNINRHKIVGINSKNTNLDITVISKPKAFFTFGIGGNKISRGVTFDNLLSMFFTRGIKGKMAQDTYIQRARMFGNRNEYKTFFQLWITNKLMSDWCTCFIFHKLAIQSALSGMGRPAWLSDNRSIPTSLSSIDKTTIDFYEGEMSFDLFDYDKDVEFMGNKDMTNIKRMEVLRSYLSQACFPKYVQDYILANSVSEEDVCFHRSAPFGIKKTMKYTPEEIANIRRIKGIFSYQEFQRGDRPNARHHLKIYFNAEGKARLFYKVNGSSIRFMQNKR